MLLKEVSVSNIISWAILNQPSIFERKLWERRKAEPDTATVYFNRWQDPSFLNELTRRCFDAISKPGDVPRDDDEDLDPILCRVARCSAPIPCQVEHVIIQVEHVIIFVPA